MSTQQKIAILNSRQGLYPCRLHTWVRQTLNALDSVKGTKPIILSSVGMSTWDIVTVTASSLNLNLVLYIQIKDNQLEQTLIDSIITAYNLNPQKVSFVIITETNTNKFQLKRDLAIVSQADKIFPVLIREKGNLESLLLSQKNKIESEFLTPFKNRTHKISYSIDSLIVNEQLKEISQDYIIHWTKTSKNKWYHESLHDYYTKILQSDSYPRKAIDTLCNIIKLKTLFATPTHMPKNISTVSFTSLSPIEMIPLFRWRSRYNEMSFEPYGIGFKKDLAQQNSIKQVIYYDKNNLSDQQLTESDLWYTQSKGGITNWELEQEYRHLGDFNFETIEKKNIILFTRYKKEADQLQKLTGIHTISFE